jgi:hypothetical protein
MLSLVYAECRILIVMLTFVMIMSLVMHIVALPSVIFVECRIFYCYVVSHGHVS